MSDLGDALSAAEVTTAQLKEANDVATGPDGGWETGSRFPTPEEAQAYLDAHSGGSGDPELLDLCDRVVIGSQHRATSFRGDSPVDRSKPGGPAAV